MPTITVLTAVLDGRHQFLRDAYMSLLQQQMPDGWTWEWVVQEDGETGRPAHELDADDPRVSTGTAPRGRAATARTYALSRATGDLVRTLDADDMLIPGALAQDIQLLTDRPDLAWCVSPAIDVRPDGSEKPGPRDPVAGPLPPRFLYEGERDGLLQVLGTTLCTYTDLVRAVGGWQALPADEDVALLLAVEAVSDGWMHSAPSLYYRRWDGQTTAQQDKTGPADHSPRRQVVLDHADAMRAAGWRWKAPLSLS